MGREIILSILTPAVFGRVKRAEPHWTEIERWIARVDYPVEHLVFCDNKMRTIGEKRDALLRMARGKYVAYLDDDDRINRFYIPRIIGAAADDPDVITFKQHASVNGEDAVIEFRLGNPNEPFAPQTIVRRNAWHVCAWRRRIAILSWFPAVDYGEDLVFSERLCKIDGLREVHVPEVLHYYLHDSATTEAPGPGS